MGWFWRTLLLLIFQSPVDGMELLQTHNDALVDCMQSIVSAKHEIFSKGIRISVETESPEIRTDFRDTVDRFLVHYRGIVDIDSVGSSTYSTEVRLIFLDSLKAFRLVVGRQLTADTSGGSMYHLVVLPVDTSMGTVEDILDFCLKNNILHINVLIKDDNDTITLYTFYPYSETKCYDSTPRIHNRFTNGSFEWNKPLFPRKVDNFWQCPLRIAIWDNPPYIYVDESQVSGMSVEILSSLAALMNFSFEFTESSDRGHRNKSFIAALKLLSDGDADISIVPVTCNTEKKEHFAITTLYHMPEQLLITKNPERFSSLEILILPFDSATWTVLFIFLSAKWIGSILCRIYSSRVDVPFGEHSTRLRTMAWLLSIFVLQSCYEGSVFRFLQKQPTKRPVNDLKEAIKQNYKVIVDIFTYNDMKTAAMAMPQLVEVKNMNPENILNTLDKYEGKYGCFANSDLLRFVDSTIEKYTVAKSPVRTYLGCMILPKYSFLKTEIEIRYGQMVENGLVDRIYKTNIGVDHVSKSNKADEKGFQILSMYDLVGAFQLLAIMVGLSVGIFLMEILSKRWERLAVAIDFLERIV